MGSLPNTNDGTDEHCTAYPLLNIRAHYPTMVRPHTATDVKLSFYEVEDCLGKMMLSSWSPDRKQMRKTKRLMNAESGCKTFTELFKMVWFLTENARDKKMQK